MFHCLSVNNIDEREKVVSMFLYGFERLGQERLITFLNDLTAREIRLIDLVHTMERQLSCGKQAGEVKSTLKISKHRGNGSGRHGR